MVSFAIRTKPSPYAGNVPCFFTLHQILYFGEKKREDSLSVYVHPHPHLRIGVFSLIVVYLLKTFLPLRMMIPL